MPSCWPGPGSMLRGRSWPSASRGRAATVPGWPAQSRRPGVPVIECGQPTRKTRRGKGNSDPVDAYLAVLTALRPGAGKLPTLRANGDREALRILLCARQELTTTATAQANRLRALLGDGDDRDRDLARGHLGDAVLAGLARRRPPRDASRALAVRQGEIHRLAVALRDASRALKANRAELGVIVGDLALGLASRPGIGPVSAAQAIVSFSHPGRCRHEAASPGSPGPAPSRHPAARSPATGSTAAATGH
jgi:transposase